jgi:beta-lactamase regulating signal transducer with metallopeptidase domain
MQSLLAIGLSNAVMATLLAFAAAGITRIWRAPALSHVLWLLVLLKLVTPPIMSVRLPQSLGTESGTVSAESLVSESKPLPSARVHQSEQLSSSHKSTSTNNAVDFAIIGAAGAHPDEWSFAGDSAEMQGVSSTLQRLWNATPIEPLVLALWISGTTVCLLLAGIRILRFQGLLCYARPGSPLLQEQARQLAHQLGLARCPTIWLAPGPVSPLLWAVGGRARLILPAALFERLRPEQQATLLLHELAHARRHDHWVRWLELAATCLYWWHPVAWWARHALQNAEEHCCDAWVVWTLPGAAKAYAKALLQTVEFLDARPALPPVASGFGHVHFLKRRLSMIVRKPLCPQLSWPACLAIVFLGLLVLPFGPQRSEAQGTAGVVANDDTDAATAADTGQASSRRDLERRLQSLEQKMDRVLQSLKEKPGKADEEKRVIIKRETKDAGKHTTKPEAKERKRHVEIELKGVDAEHMKDVEKRIHELVQQVVNPEQMKQLQKQIHDAVHQAVDPERMKQLQQQIESTVNKAIDPERMRLLQERIDSAVSKNVNPERIEALARQIEEAVTKSLDAAGQGGRRAATAPRAVERPRAQTPPKAAETARNRQDRDLERRLDRLEQKMERVIEALESARKSRGGDE